MVCNIPGDTKVEPWSDSGRIIPAALDLASISEGQFDVLDREVEERAKELPSWEIVIRVAGVDVYAARPGHLPVLPDDFRIRDALRTIGAAVGVVHVSKPDSGPKTSTQEPEAEAKAPEKTSPKKAQKSKTKSKSKPEATPKAKEAEKKPEPVDEVKDQGQEPDTAKTSEGSANEKPEGPATVVEPYGTSDREREAAFRFLDPFWDGESGKFTEHFNKLKHKMIKQGLPPGTAEQLKELFVKESA